MDKIIYIIKRYFLGVYYMLTLQWDKARDLAAGRDIK